MYKSIAFKEERLNNLEKQKKEQAKNHKHNNKK